MTKILLDFFTTTDTIAISRLLLGKTLVTNINGIITSGIITETEAYCGINDKACHAYNNRKTKRTEAMFLKGGIAYIYLCYGIHHLFNVVTNIENEPHAVLIRGIKVVKGHKTMTERAGKEIKTGQLLNGPGKLTKALGITTKYNKTPLDGNTIWIEENNLIINDEDIITGERIGVDYAGNDAKLPYRFFIKSIKLK